VVLLDSSQLLANLPPDELALLDEAFPISKEPGITLPEHIALLLHFKRKINMTVLYPSPMTRRTIEQAVANHKLILWIYDNLKTLYFNPTISVGPLAGATCTPSDGGLAFGADFVVRGRVDGFVAAAELPVYTWAAVFQVNLKTTLPRKLSGAD